MRSRLSGVLVHREKDVFVHREKDPFNDKIRLMTFNEERKDPFNDKQSQIAERKTGGKQRPGDLKASFPAANANAPLACGRASLRRRAVEPAPGSGARRASSADIGRCGAPWVSVGSAVLGGARCTAGRGTHPSA